MANKAAILDKIARNLKQRGLSEAAVVRGADSVSVTKTGGQVLTISYVDKAIQAPMGGVSDAATPFLGIGTAAPGSLKIKGGAAEATLTLIFAQVEALQVLMVCAGFANDIVVENGTSTAELARLRGSEGVQGVGM